MLISVGVSGFDLVVDRLPRFEPVCRAAGIGFLLTYGLRALAASAYAHGGALVPDGHAAPSRRAALASALAFTWLNPHVYLDAVVVLGSVSARFAGERVAFAAGAIAASFAFFFALGHGARFLQPLFSGARAWRALDAAVGTILLALAFGLAFGD